MRHLSRTPFAWWRVHWKLSRHQRNWPRRAVGCMQHLSFSPRGFLVAVVTGASQSLGSNCQVVLEIHRSMWLVFGWWLWAQEKFLAGRRRLGRKNHWGEGVSTRVGGLFQKASEILREIFRNKLWSLGQVARLRSWKPKLTTSQRKPC